MNEEQLEALKALPQSLKASLAEEILQYQLAMSDIAKKHNAVALLVSGPLDKLDEELTQIFNAMDKTKDSPMTRP